MLGYPDSLSSNWKDLPDIRPRAGPTPKVNLAAGCRKTHARCESHGYSLQLSRAEKQPVLRLFVPLSEQIWRGSRLIYGDTQSGVSTGFLSSSGNWPDAATSTHSLGKSLASAWAGPTIDNENAPNRHTVRASTIHRSPPASKNTGKILCGPQPIFQVLD